MSIQHFGKGALRVAKNYTKGYSDVQAKVREATSNDPWGPSGTQMNEIAQMSYNQNDFVEIMEMIDKRLNDKGKNWRHVFKSLTVLDYLLHAGSENVVIYFRDNIYIIKTLKEFQYVDEYGKDQGANVRQKAKDITNLLTDEGRLRQERRSRASMRDRMLGAPGDDDGLEGDENSRRRAHSNPPARKRDEDELTKAIEASKRSLAEEQARGAEDRDLAEAMRLSKEEEERRARAAQDSGPLFDDQQNDLYVLLGNQNLLVDPNPIPQFQTGLQPQFTAIQPQFTSFNPYQQQAQQEAMQAEYLRQQQEWLAQQQQLQAQAQAAQMAQQQQEELMRQQQYLMMQQQQQQQMQPLVPQPTAFGSNNPFAAFGSPPPMPSNASSPGPGAAPNPVNFNLGSTYENHNTGANLSNNELRPTPPQPSTSAPPGGGSQRGPRKADQEHAHLANLFAAREDGVDTFGNYGQLRYGGTDAGRLVTQKTGAPTGGSSFNPFAQQQQQQQHQQQGSDQPFFSI
ncbi:ENTH-domain-containing protein [Stereum hirsutum FP-91666 SS1]|uniref:ENTH-domain-containing protein n=1 Tax=Stereum hirsutum (strain FP-91666) TaxID=721885 RepID=UPI00044495F0|nr:ENTH-domain-containing protein [Stereum hirsutum FP-91666 SS1]EIM80614.1 ENTH-domain-containing protein [Stereum hirsutum FP-91666 SS1]